MKKYNLERFIEAQNYSYNDALSEIKSGRKKSHWIWYIFPQLKDLGRSSTAKLYGIENIEEATLYLKHEILGSRLREISQALLEIENNNPYIIMGGHPDDWKLQSCMTLFAKISEEDSVFHKVLKKFFDGKLDENTINLLKS